MIKTLNCFICGTNVKTKNGVGKCPKCKASWIRDSEGNITRYYANEAIEPPKI